MCGCDDPLLLWQLRHASGTRSLGRDSDVARGEVRCEERRGMATLSCASDGRVAAEPVDCRLSCITSGRAQQLTVGSDVATQERRISKVNYGHLLPAS